jgi:NO-binding membrane sensor protein with MHYT domain
MMVAAAALIALSVVPVRYGTYDLRALLVIVLVAVLVAYWVAAVADLLRKGPGEQREWWLASLAVVVLLGPLGAFAYHVASPRFTLDEERLRSTQR